MSGAFPNERAALEEGGIEEERRLFYVALTRARKNLYLSHALLGGKQNEFVVSPSPFIEEIDEVLLHDVRRNSWGSGQKTDSLVEPAYTYDPDETQTDWRKKNFLGEY